MFVSTLRKFGFCGSYFRLHSEVRLPGGGVFSICRQKCKSPVNCPSIFMLPENYVDLHTELGNHPSRSLLLNSLISFCVWDLYSISSGWVVTDALLNSISTFPL